MNKYLMIAVFLLAGVTYTAAQDPAFEKGAHYLTAGYGRVCYEQKFMDFTNTMYTNDTPYKAGTTYYNKYGPFFLKWEYAAGKHVGIGINMAYSGSSLQALYHVTDTGGNKILVNDQYKLSNTSFLFRLNFHFLNSETWDLYWGPAIGYRYGNYSFTTNYVHDLHGSIFSSVLSLLPATGLPVGADCTLGLRIMMSPNFAMYGEYGMAKALFQFGFSYKIPKTNYGYY